MLYLSHSSIALFEDVWQRIYHAGMGSPYAPRPEFIRFHSAVTILINLSNEFETEKFPRRNSLSRRWVQ